MLTPLEIENKQFKNAMFGYDKEEVEDFLNQVLEDYEALYRENVSNKDKIGSLNSEISQYKTIEETLQNTLVVAQSAGEEVKKNASEKAENILKEAQLEAGEVIKRANEQVASILSKYNEIKRNIDVYNAKISSLIATQQKIIEEFSLKDNVSISLAMPE